MLKEIHQGLTLKGSQSMNNHELSVISIKKIKEKLPKIGPKNSFDHSSTLKGSQSMTNHEF